MNKGAGRSACRWVAASLMLAALPALAQMDPTSVAINISGTVVANASCTFSGQNPLQVEYGDVYINDLAQGAYRKQLDYTLTCRGDPDGKAVAMQLQGAGADFNNTILKTDAKGLGIKLLNNGSTQNMNSWFTIDPTSPPMLQAELVKQDGATFSNGQEFNASATLVVAYR